MRESSNCFALTQAGREEVNELEQLGRWKEVGVRAICSGSEEQMFIGNSSDEKFAQRLASEAIVKAFRARGLAIAKGVFAGQSTSPEELSDILEKSLKQLGNWKPTSCGQLRRSDA